MSCKVVLCLCEVLLASFHVERIVSSSFDAGTQATERGRAHLTLPGQFVQVDHLPLLLCMLFVQQQYVRSLICNHSFLKRGAHRVGCGASTCLH
jgi:hypothetical protein